jgi:hypothetical protein
LNLLQGQEDYSSEDNPVRAIDVFVDELDLANLGFGGRKASLASGDVVVFNPGQFDKFFPTNLSQGNDPSQTPTKSASLAPDLTLAEDAD